MGLFTKIQWNNKVEYQVGNAKLDIGDLISKTYLGDYLRDYPNWVWFDRCLFEKYSMFLVALKMAESVCFWVHEIWYYMTVSVDSQAFIV